MNFIFREYTHSDFPEVNNLWEATGVGGVHRGDTAEVIEETIQAGGRLIIMACAGSGEIIGTSWLTNDARRIYLHHFCIREDHRRKGYAKILAAESLRFAKEKGKQLKLEVHRSNTEAICLYEKCGFKYLGDYLVMIIRDVQNAELK